MLIYTVMYDILYIRDVQIFLTINGERTRGIPLSLAVNTRTVLAIVPPQGCEAILVEILQSKRYCLLVKTPSRSQHSGGDN